MIEAAPDHGDTVHLPGRHATLGLGYWEDRADDETDEGLDDLWGNLIRRSNSISNPIFDEHGYLATHQGMDGLEFDIVHAKTTEDNIPALTPRLALMGEGDRTHLGPKVTGRYTLHSVVDPAATVVFLGTGTGEAPHISMAVGLLRKGHYGPIVSAVSVRRWADLGYLDKQRQLESRYGNYHHLPLPTREPDVDKRYIQNLITEDSFVGELGIDVDPHSTHVFLCGNPAVIGLPELHDGQERFPETVGAVQVLTERGLTLDRRVHPATSTTRSTGRRG